MLDFTDDLKQVLQKFKANSITLLDLKFVVL
jgi:hypothetical protein